MFANSQVANNTEIESKYFIYFLEKNMFITSISFYIKWIKLFFINFKSFLNLILTKLTIFARILPFCNIRQITLSDIRRVTHPEDNNLLDVNFSNLVDLYQE